MATAIVWVLVACRVALGRVRRGQRRRRRRRSVVFARDLGFSGRFSEDKNIAQMEFDSAVDWSIN